LGTQAQAYSFDNTGNRLEKDDSGGSGPSKELSTFDAANRILSRGSQAYTSDADGNLLSDGARTYTWDSQNRLAQCVSTINGTITTSSYTYGADGLRRSATVAGVTTYYAYDGQSCVQEYKPGGNSHLNVSANYLMGPRGPECRADETDISEPFLSAAASSYFHQIGEGSGFNMSGATGYANSYPAFADGPRAHTSWYVYDGLGSVIGTVDGKSLAYTPGPKRDVYGIPRTSATLPTPHGFVGALGHPTDPTGLIYMRARYYDPKTGRFISEDASRNGANWFVYADDNAVNGGDPSGRDTSGVLQFIWDVIDYWDKLDGTEFLKSCGGLKGLNEWANNALSETIMDAMKSAGMIRAADADETLADGVGDLPSQAVAGAQMMKSGVEAAEDVPEISGLQQFEDFIMMRFTDTQ